MILNDCSYLQLDDSDDDLLMNPCCVVLCCVVPCRVVSMASISFDIVCSPLLLRLWRRFFSLLYVQIYISYIVRCCVCVCLSVFFLLFDSMK